MATALSQLSFHNFNPHFFAYSQFPLYLGFFSLVLTNQSINFTNAIIVLRLWSALFSLLSLVILYYIYPNKYFILFLIFTPGLIQISHFGTTESILFFVFVTNILIAKKIILSPMSKTPYLLAGIVAGIGLATKISAAIFLLPIFFSIIFSFRKFKNFLYPILIINIILLSSLSISILLSPYNLIDKQDFRSAISYETQVATGSMKVFYTNQFRNTSAYLFQFTKIFPFTYGIPIYIFGFFGLFLGIINFKKSLHKTFVFCTGLSVLIFFLYFGQVYVKWTRFMSPIFFIFPLLASYLIVKINNKLLKLFSTVLCIIPGILFFTIYLYPDIRLTASDWINKNIPPQSVILSEAGNVVNLPLFSRDLRVNNFDFYNLDDNPNLPSELVANLAISDYIIIPSRRIFSNQYGKDFPVSTNYYQNLTNGQLGFMPLKKFAPNYDFFLNSEKAEETWSVFDHPTIRIFKKVKQLSIQEYEKILQS